MKITRTPLAAALAIGLGLGASAAMAGHVPGVNFAAQNFVVNPSAVGEPQGPFSARYIDFSYQAEVDQTGTSATTGSFTETGAATFSTFRTKLNQPPVSATVSGLNTTYNLYALFTASGTVANNAAGGVNGVFTTFNVQFFVDPTQNTTFTSPTAGVGGGDESRTVAAGGGEDILVLTGTLVVGGFHVFPGLANGDFDVQFTVTGCGAGAATGFFCGPGGLQVSSLGDFNGVNTSIVSNPALTGAGDSRTDILINGSGNVSFGIPFGIPEPESVLLLGLGLAGMGFVSRRRKNG